MEADYSSEGFLLQETLCVLTAQKGNHKTKQKNSS